MLVHELVQAQAEQRPSAPYLTAKGVTASYAQFCSQVLRLAAYLRSSGVERGDRVLIALPNGIEFFTAHFAALSAGAVAVPLSHRTPPNRLRYIVEDCTPVVIATSQPASQVAQANAGGHLREQISVGEISPDPQPGLRVTGWSACLDAAGPHSATPAGPPAPSLIDVDPAMIVYTSGSTGTPKGILCSHLNVVSAATSISQYLKMQPDDKVIDVLPPFFDYGLYQAILCALAGAELVLGDDAVFVDRIVETIECQGITGIPLVPSIAASLLNYLKVSGRQLSVEARQRVRFVTSTGAAFHPKYISGLRAHFPEARIYSMYGLSECKRVAFLDPDLAEAKPYSVGKPMSNVEVWVADDDGRPLPPGELGTLIVRGSNVAVGYWGDPELSRRTFRMGRYGERLLVTNDLFVQDEDGFLYFKGRRDDIIKSGAYRISLKEVCDILLSIDGVSEAIVAPIDDERLGQTMRAYVVREEGVALTERDLRRKMRALVETGLKIPKEIEFVAALPKTATHKIDRRRLQAMPGVTQSLLSSDSLL